MNRDEIDWRSGTVTYWVMNDIDESAPLATQLDELREDLAQVTYSDRVLIDVGWYPSFSRNGRFIVRVIQDRDWEHPLVQDSCRSFEALRASLDRAVNAAQAANRSSSAT